MASLFVAHRYNSKLFIYNISDLSLLLPSSPTLLTSLMPRRTPVSDVRRNGIIPITIVIPIDRAQSLRETLGERTERASRVLVVLRATFDPDGECAVVEEKSDRGTNVGAV